MDKILGKDQATYSKERDGFLRDLQHFHDTRGTPIKRAPTLGGKEVDLYLLYVLVTSQGGWLRVNSKNSWSEVLLQLQLPRACINGSVALKQIYLRYLDRWEKVHFLHEEGDRTSDDDEESRHKRWSARTLHCVPYTYNYNQHNVNETNREYNHLATNLYKSSDYDRLALSLISPLPNEQDFAINVCTLLSNDGKHTLKLQKHPRLITYLLGHAGVFNHSSLRKLFVHFYSDIRKQPIHNFWRDVVEFKEFLELTNENNFKLRRDTDDAPADAAAKEGADAAVAAATAAATALLPSVTPMELDVSMAMAMATTAAAPPSETVCTVHESDSESEDESLPKDSDCDNDKVTYDDAVDSELFGLRRSLGTQDYVGQRVLQIATILRNLSFIEENIALLVQNTSFIRFLLLCCTSQWNILRNLGMDMLGNLAPEFLVRDLQTDVLAVNLLKVVNKGLQDQDRACCLSSLEVLNKLSQNEKNEDILLRSLETDIYRNVCAFLTIHDVMLLIYTLECLYSLSSLGERSCHLIVNNHGVIDTLVALVTVEGKSYGPKACIGMKLVETLPSGSSQAQSQAQQQPGSSSTTTTTTTSVSTATTTTASTSTPIVSTTPAMRATPPTTPIRPVSIAPQRLIAMTPAPTPPPPVPTVCVSVPTPIIHHVAPPQAPVSVQPLQPAISTHPMTPQQLIQQQHAHQQAIHENEQFALAWLRAAYEPCLDGGKVDHQELYRHYMNSCSKIGRRGVISPLHFPRCVRSVFGGTVGPNPMKPHHPNDPQYYEGIKVRDNPLAISIQQQQQPQPISIPKINVAAAAAKGQQARRKSAVQTATAPLTVSPTDGGDAVLQASPASPILKAQLSAPPKQRDSVIATSTANASSKGDMKSQAMAHPHLSQALLGTTTAATSMSAVSAATVTVVASASSCGASNNAGSQTSSTSLIKSLLATKVNDCMSTTVSMRTATDCQNVAQVAARQQRLLAQGGGGGTASAANTPDQQKLKPIETPKLCRMNGVRQLFSDNEIGDPSVSSTTQFTSLIKGKKEPPQPPPPPLAPLSNNVKGGKTQRIDNEDSDSIGNNSAASSSGIGTVGIGGISSTEDGDNSLTCFEGLLNGIPSLEHPLNEDSNSKDSVRIVSNEMAINKPLRLADLLEKKFEKSPPLLNGTLGKELKMGDKAMDLVENHIEKALSRETDVIVKLEDPGENVLPNLKRSASEDIIDVDAKKPMLSSNFNGSTTADSPNPDSVSSSNGDEGPTTVSTAAAKLFADIAADILEDEDEEQLMQEAQAPIQMIEQSGQVQIPQAPLQQIIVDNNQQVLLTQPRQIIVSQSQPTNQVMINTGTPMKTQTGQTVIVQNAGGGQRPMMLQQANAGQFMLQQGQMQLVHQSGGHQYVLQTGGSQGAYVVAAQPQTAVVHGQPQTVLVAQTQQQQGTPAKTIIILQQQATASPQPTHHQKVVVTPQGQQVVVTQVPRPIAHTSSMSNNVVQCSPKVPKSVATSTGVTQTMTANCTTDKWKEDIKPKLKIVRDLTTPYVCEWGECNVEKKFKSANEVYLHVCASHCPTGNEEIICLWDRCDTMKRKRFSLMTHLHDKHCNTEAMRQGLIRRKLAAHSAKVETVTPTTSSPHPGYAPDAALHAIKRHALEFVNPKELQDDNEGPVTKSIRLTASLILRNLVIYSSHCKRYLKSYESHLANVALSNVESSRTIAQVLYDMNDGSTPQVTYTQLTRRIADCDRVRCDV